MKIRLVVTYFILSLCITMVWAHLADAPSELSFIKGVIGYSFILNLPIHVFVLIYGFNPASSRSEMKGPISPKISQQRIWMPISSLLLIHFCVCLMLIYMAWIAGERGEKLFELKWLR